MLRSEKNERALLCERGKTITMANTHPCPECNEPVDEDALTCPHCNAVLPEPVPAATESSSSQQTEPMRAIPGGIHVTVNNDLAPLPAKPKPQSQHHTNPWWIVA